MNTKTPFRNPVEDSDSYSIFRLYDKKDNSYKKSIYFLNRKPIPTEILNIYISEGYIIRLEDVMNVDSLCIFADCVVISEKLGLYEVIEDEFNEV